MRADHLNDVAGADVFLALGDVGEKGVLLHIGFERRRGRLGGKRNRPVFQRLLEQRDESINFLDRIVVGVFRLGAVLDDRVHENGHRLPHAIEYKQFVGDQEIHRGRAQLILGRTRHHRLHVMNKFVPHKSHRAAGKPRQPRQIHRAIAAQNALHHLQPVAHVMLARFATHRVGGRHLTALHHLHLIAILPNDPARIAADKRVPAQVLAALHALTQKRLAARPNFAIGRKRRLEVRQNLAVDRNQISFLRVLQKCLARGRDVQNVAHDFLMYNSSESISRSSVTTPASSFTLRKKQTLLPL